MPFGDKAKLKYFIPLLLFGIGMGVTADPTMWPSQIINGTMYLQIIFCNISFIIVSTARFSQIYEIWRNKSTGTLSFITFFLIFIGNIARLFTIMVEADNDWIFKFSVMTAAFLNGFICTQFILYWNNTGKQK